MISSYIILSLLEYYAHPYDIVSISCTCKTFYNKINRFKYVKMNFSKQTLQNKYNISIIPYIRNNIIYLNVDAYEAISEYNVYILMNNYEDQIEFDIIHLLDKVNCTDPYQTFSNELNFSDISPQSDYNTYFDEVLFKCQVIPEEFISANLDKYLSIFGWEKLCKYQNFSDNFIRLHINSLIDIEEFYKYQNISDNIIDEFAGILDWECISFYINPSEHIMLKYSEKIIFHYMYERGIYFSNKLILKLLKYIDINLLAQHQSLPEEFIEDNIDLFDMYSVSIGCKLSDEFMIKYQDKLEWMFIIINNEFSEYLLETIKEENLRRVLSSFHVNKTNENNIYYYLTENIILKYEKCLYWEYISKHSKLSYEFILKYHEKIWWKNILYNNRSPIELFNNISIEY